MTTADKLAYLQGTKEAIRTAIVDKGVPVPEETTFREYATKISQIPSGGGAPVTPKVDPFTMGLWESNFYNNANNILLELPDNAHVGDSIFIFVFYYLEIPNPVSFIGGDDVTLLAVSEFGGSDDSECAVEFYRLEYDGTNFPSEVAIAGSGRRFAATFSISNQAGYELVSDVARIDSVQLAEGYELSLEVENSPLRDVFKVISLGWAVASSIGATYPASLPRYAVVVPPLTVGMAGVRNTQRNSNNQTRSCILGLNMDSTTQTKDLIFGYIPASPNNTKGLSRIELDLYYQPVP